MDGTTHYYLSGQSIVEERDGSNNILGVVDSSGVLVERYEVRR